MSWVLSFRFGFSQPCDFLGCSKLCTVLWSLGSFLPVTKGAWLYICLLLLSLVSSWTAGSHLLTGAPILFSSLCYIPKPGSSSSPPPPSTQSPSMLICSPGKGGISAPSRGSIWPSHSLFKGTWHTTENKKIKQMLSKINLLTCQKRKSAHLPGLVLSKSHHVDA